MIKSRFFAAFTLSILLAVSVIPVHAAAEFKEPKIAEVHSILDASVTKRIAKIPRLTFDEKTMIASAVASLNRSFVNLDAHFSSTDPLRPQAIRQLVRSYSNLSKLLKRVSASKGVASVASATVTDTVQAGAKSSGTEAEILYYADDFEGRGTAMGDRFSQEVFSAARCGTEL